MMGPSSESAATSQTSLLGEKILFCGLSEAGKTAIRDLVFGGKQAQEVEGYGATINYVRQIVSMDSGRMFTIMDLGGQRIFLERFINQFSPFVFHRVKALVYIVDVSDWERYDSAKKYFDNALARMKQHSPSAEIFVFLHKMDLIKYTSDKTKFVQYLRNLFQRDVGAPIVFFETSIYDNSVREAFDKLLSISFPEMDAISRPVESGELASTDLESPQMEPLTAIKSAVDPIIPSKTGVEVPQPSYSQFKSADEVNLTEIAKAIGLVEDFSEKPIDSQFESPDEVNLTEIVQAIGLVEDLSVGSTELELLSQEEISPRSPPEFILPNETEFDIFAEAEQLIEYLESIVISLELLYIALIGENGESLIEIGDRIQYLEIIEEIYNSFKLNSSTTSELIDFQIVETEKLLIAAQPIRSSFVLMLAGSHSIKNRLLEKMSEIRSRITQIVNKSLYDST